ELKYVRTINSPKQFLYPYRIPLVIWHREGYLYRVEEPFIESMSIAFFCIKPCDANAIHALDKQLLNEPQDPIYKKKRMNSLIIVYDCNLQDEYCFCESVDARRPRIYDIWIVPSIDRIYIAVGSSRGLELLNFIGIERFKELSREPRIPVLQTQRIAIDKLKNLRHHYDSSKWIEISKRCLLCGGCTASCPTCICFDIVESVSPTLNEGSRIRIWTSCVLKSFTMVAGGRIVRKDREERFKFRYFHKFVFSIDRYGIFLCTGCGRCSAQCPAGINIIEVIKSVV
ncbi:MAG TPA: hypothetical protein ENF93_02250, partial [Ignisphaera sp.]|nr:hypothetical protein [Ignisphaera sp.]